MAKKSSTTVSVNKIAFWLLVVAAIAYLVNLILSIVGVNSSIVSWIASAAAALMVCVSAVLAWRYVRNKPTVWIVLYVIIILVVLAGLVLPNILL